MGHSSTLQNNEHVSANLLVSLISSRTTMPPKKAEKKSVAEVEDSGSGSEAEEKPAKESPAKKKGTGLQKPLKMSADLTKLLKLPKDEEMSRPQIVKHLWAYLKENKQWFTPDKAMEPIFGKEKIKALGMTKYLKGH